MTTDTIFAHSSGHPPAAIAVLRISGSRAFDAAERLCGRLPQPRRAAVRSLRNADSELLDQAMVVRFDGPASATGEDVVELHCHGGRAVVSAVLAELGRVDGLREARPGEFTRRAFENGRMDLTEAEGLADLLEAETEAQRRAALAVAGGAIRRQVEEWRERLVTLSALAEAAIDYDDEDETIVDAERLAGSSAALGREIEHWLKRPRSELLKRGIRIVIAGPPNAGKSSLLNRLAGLDRAIVSAEAGTTRDVIEVPVAAEGIPLLLVDTAGLRDEAGEVERVGIGLAEKQVATADILIWMGDPAQTPPHPHVILVHGRADLSERANVPSGSVPVSATTGLGADVLMRRVVELARTLLPAGSDVPLNHRQAAALEEAAAALCVPETAPLVILAEGLRHARSALDLVTGRIGVEDVLDALFGRFCLGK